MVKFSQNIKGSIYTLFLIYTIIFILFLTTPLAQMETISSETRTASGGSRYHYTLDLTTDVWTRGNEYGLTVSLVIDSMAQNKGLFGENIRDFHDISIKIQLKNAENVIEEKSFPDSGVILAVNASHMVTWTIIPDNSFDDLVGIYVSSSFREDIPSSGDPLTEDGWVEMETLSLNGDFAVPLSKQLTNPVTILIIIGLVIILIWSYKKRNSINNAIGNINISPNKEQFYRISKLYIAVFSGFLIMLLLSGILGAILSSSGDSDYAFHFEIETETSNWERGESYELIVKLFSDSFGSYSDFHDISMTITIQENSTILYSSSSPASGVIDRSFTLSGDKFYSTVWTVFPDDTFPDSIDLYVSSTFRLDKSGGFDPRIVTDNVKLATFQVTGSSSETSSVHIKYSERGSKLRATLFIIGIILFILAIGYVKDKDKRNKKFHSD